MKVCYVVIGWNLGACAPEDNANASRVYATHAEAQNAMREFCKEDLGDNWELEIDDNVVLNDPDLDCITINGGNRGYYIQSILMPDSPTNAANAKLRKVCDILLDGELCADAMVDEISTILADELDANNN